MAGQIASAYVQIIPTTNGIASGIGEALGGEGTKGGKRFGSGFLNAAKKFITTAAIAKTFKSALAAGGALQQSFGGIETIYGDASVQMERFANRAYQYGLSANAYAEQAVSFGAALKQAYGGDTIQAMTAANTSLQDMADNSAKMGTDIGAIQSAYQGFAKQNYTMLDNLKLGYGGTQSEMQRLLADAQAITGVKYDIKNLGDVYDAIHVIQGQLGLTGVAAEEAKHTLTGSFGAMKAAATNLLADLALGNNIQQSLGAMTDSVVNFASNAIPMVTNIIGAAPRALVGLVNGLAPVLLSSGIDAVMQLGTGLSAAIPSLLSGVSNFIPMLVNAFSTGVPQLLSVGAQMVQSIASGILPAIPGLIASLPGIVSRIASTISAGIPVVLNAAKVLFSGIVQALPTVISSISAALPQIISTIANFIASNVDQIVNAGIELLMGLVEAIPTIVGALTAAAPEIINALIGAITTMAPALWNAAVALFTNIVGALGSIAGMVSSAAGNVISNAVNAVKSWAGNMLSAASNLAQQIASGISQKAVTVATAARTVAGNVVSAVTGFVGELVSAGRNLIAGLASGISQAVGEAVAAARNAAASVIGAAKGILGIHSPSTVFRDEVGYMMMLGLAEGIEDNTKPVTDAIDDISTMAVKGVDTNLGVNASLGISTDAAATSQLTQLIGIVSALSSQINNLRIYLDGDTLVGSITDRMNSALGMRSTMDERGLA